MSIYRDVLVIVNIYLKKNQVKTKKKSVIHRKTSPKKLLVSIECDLKLLCQAGR